MTTTFSSLPIVDLSPLSLSAVPTSDQLSILSKQLYTVFATTGFAYLTNPPLSFAHEDVFGLARGFFSMPETEKMNLAKKTFKRENANTYRGYFPPQPDNALDNLKEGFEMGPSKTPTPTFAAASARFNLLEPNVWPSPSAFPSRSRAEQLHHELQALSSALLSLLATSLGKSEHFFSSYLVDSLSTLRFLHYPPQAQRPSPTGRDGEEPKLCCTPHTDSGILTLLHQDSTGGLEVRNSAGEWISAPYVPGSIVVNIGDLMARVSGGRFVATMHRVKASDGTKSGNGEGMGRFSVPFFFEPGEACVVKSVDENTDGAVYGEHIRRKMGTWVEYEDVQPLAAEVEGNKGQMVEAY